MTPKFLPTQSLPSNKGSGSHIIIQPYYLHSPWWLPANIMAFGRGVGRVGSANQTIYTRNTGLKETLRAVLQNGNLKNSICHPEEEIWHNWVETKSTHLLWWLRKKYRLIICGMWELVFFSTSRQTTWRAVQSPVHNILISSSSSPSCRV